MDICIGPISVEQKSVLVRMMELFKYDFSEFSGEDINEYGYFGYPYIDAYWNERGRYPFFIRVDGKLAGFILVRPCGEYSDIPGTRSIAELFVMRKYRRRGVGGAAATRVFDMFPGGWEITHWENNMPAHSFWERVLNGYTNGEYHTFSARGKRGNEVVGFTFDNSGKKREEGEDGAVT